MLLRLDFDSIHIYREDATSYFRPEVIAIELAKIFPQCQIDIREDFFRHFGIASQRKASIIDLAKISDVKQPFERQPKNELSDEGVALYDGFVLQQVLNQQMDLERQIIHVHILLSGLLTCTFSEDDWRYHGRAVICGTPSIISAAGIVQGPARPREFYYPDGLRLAEIEKKKMNARFIDYGDERMTRAAVGYALQALFFFVADGDPFCDSPNCRLFNSHWQEDLIRTQVEKPSLCAEHLDMANKFNSSKVRR